MITRPNDPASPATDYTGDYPITDPGLSKREYFAALVLQGFASDPTDDARDYIDAAAAAVLWADALIVALNEPSRWP